jgi:GNAT superfamily N-acetyltransferase
MSNLPIRLRAATANDVSFIFNSWLKSYRNSLATKLIANEVYFNEHHKIIERLVKSCKVIVACSDKDPNQLYGYIVAGEQEGCFVLHYIYIKHSFRNMGIAKLLLNSFSHDPAIAAVYTHHTRVCDKLAPRFNLIYHPYLLINNTEESNE